MLNLEGEVGGVAPGMLADLLVVDGDPSEDITVLQDRTRIETIILDGEVVEVDRDLESWPNEQSLTYAIADLTQEELVARRPRGSPCPPRAAPWSRSLATRSRSDGENRATDMQPK